MAARKFREVQSRPDSVGGKTFLGKGVLPGMAVSLSISFYPPGNGDPESVLSLRGEIGCQVVFTREVRTHHTPRYATQKKKEILAALDEMKTYALSLIEDREREVREFYTDPKD